MDLSTTPRGIPFGRYVIRRRLARGGMGEVFLADQLGPLGPVRPVALKRMLPQLAAEAGALRLFLEEIGLAAQLNHPNIATTYDFGEVDGVYFIAMEYVEGLTLHAIQRASGPLAVAELLAVIGPLCGALSYAHALEKALVHCDVSPQNVMISTRGTVKLLDFGIARAEAALVERARGKVAYAAPEQLRGASPDRRFDVWGLGVLVHEMATGRKPFPQEDVAGVLAAATARAYVRLADVRPELASISPVVERALEPDPQLRWPDVRVFWDELSRAAGVAPCEQLAVLIERSGSAPVSAAPVEMTATGVAVPAPGLPSSPPRPGRPASHRRPWVSAMLMGLLAGVTAMSVAVLTAMREEPVFEAALADPPPEPRSRSTSTSTSTFTPEAAPTPPVEKPRGKKQRRGRAQVNEAVTVEERAAPETNGLGFLSWRTKPWARMTFDGKPIGEGIVVDKPVPAGKHTLVVTPGDDRYAPRTIEIDIRVGLPTKVFVDFEAGTVRIDPP